ncbi:MAG TPA: hypothetical protein VFV67_19020 [Actinophytocola sp.]|uniref:hypothetical protein n=1 Tax=Actinophytocola sp. TaxID=1872138 RepID=UPI002DB95FA6|nr:hypothetical protein [Actinophytocola sp.]HEU5472744.1 hypothetical protein [Actinophytocola sp.]
MTTPTPTEGLEPLRLADVTPFLSITVLECTSDDAVVAFRSLVRFLRRSASTRGRAVAVRVRAEITLGGDDAIDEVGVLADVGFEGLYGISREQLRPPSWAGPDSAFTDVTNQLTIALRRNRLVAVWSDITSEAELRKWLRQGAAPYRFIPADILAGTFRGDGKMLWMHGVHRRRSTKADTKALGGIRLQDALDTIEDGSYAMTAAKIDFRPEDDAAVLRDLLTVSPNKSRIAWKRTSHFPMFLAAAVEALDLLEKALVGEDVPEALFSELAIRETDLSRVRGAFDISVADPDQVRGEPDADEQRVERAELLRDALLEVRGEPGSAKAIVDVGRDGIPAGTLTIKPVEDAGAFALDVRYAGPPAVESIAREIKEAIAEGDLLTVFYESGHAFRGREISRENLTSTPFPNLLFEDFTGFMVAKEKPKVSGDQAIHDAIARKGDDSLFAWVVRRYGGDWLLCDDGAGEIADFLHLDNEGTLTAIHVKAADNQSLDRRVAVTRFEQVVSQAEKNIRLLGNDALIERLSKPRIAAPAAWNSGHRAKSADFVQQLHTRVATDKTRVAIVQPHLLQAVHDQARAASQAGHPSPDSYSLALLDNLLHSTRRTVTGLWDDLTVIGCA